MNNQSINHVTYLTTLSSTLSPAQTDQPHSLTLIFLPLRRIYPPTPLPLHKIPQHDHNSAPTLDATPTPHLHLRAQHPNNRPLRSSLQNPRWPASVHPCPLRRLSLETRRPALGRPIRDRGRSPRRQRLRRI